MRGKGFVDVLTATHGVEGWHDLDEFRDVILRKARTARASWTSSRQGCGVEDRHDLDGFRDVSSRGA